LTSEQNGKNVSGYSNILHEPSKINLFAAVAPIEPESRVGKNLPNGSPRVDYCIRQESWAGGKEKRYYFAHSLRALSRVGSSGKTATRKNVMDTTKSTDCLESPLAS